LHEYGHDDPAGVAGEPDERGAAGRVGAALGELEQDRQGAAGLWQTSLSGGIMVLF